MKKYRIKNTSKRFLESHGFKYNPIFSNSEETYYSLNFPVYKWLDYIVLSCEIRVLIEKKIVTIDVYDGNNRTRYAPFYYNPGGDFSPILETINEAIDKKIKELDIYEVKRDVQRRNNKNQIYSQQKRGESRTFNKNSSRRLDRSQSSRRNYPKKG